MDDISLNGRRLGTLTGDKGIWKLNQYTVDIRDLRFPDRAALGSTPTPALNTIRIDIDTVSGIDATTARFTVADEYGLVQPAGDITVGADGHYTFTVMLEARRLGRDRDGRRYEITVTVSDLLGNVGSTLAVVIVPHGKGNP